VSGDSAKARHKVKKRVVVYSPRSQIWAEYRVSMRQCDSMVCSTGLAVLHMMLVVYGEQISRPLCFDFWMERS
jgi:hypothetical protein